MSEPPLMERLKTDLEPRTKALDADNEKKKPALSDAANGVMKAIQEHDRPVLRRYAKTLEGLVADYAALESQADQLVRELEAIDTQDPQELKLVKGLTELASKAQGRISRNYATLKDVLSKAHANEKDPAYDALMKQWAEMEAFMTAQHKVAGIRVEQFETLLELAKGALADGDAASLGQAQQRTRDRTTWKPGPTDILVRYVEFKKTCDQVLGKSLSDERARDIQKWLKLSDEIGQRYLKVDQIAAAVLKLKAAPARPVKLNTQKAAGLIAVDEARLKKAWGDGTGDPEKVLDGLAREAKLKSSGKQLAATLRKAGLLA